jgi:hypothetical protein
MKNTMFKIVGVFSFIGAVLALVLAVGFGYKGGATFIKGAGIWFIDVEEQVKEKENPLDLGIENYKVQKVLSASKSAKEGKGSLNAADAHIDSAFETRKDELIDIIAKEIGGFASVANQDGVNRDRLEEYFDKATIVEGQEYLAFLEKLSVDIKALTDKASEIAKLNPDDKKYVSWMEYVQWYLQSYMAQVTERQQEIENRKTQAAADQAAGLSVLAIAGGVFVIFIMFVMLMLVVQIEKNTRKDLA